MKRYFDVVLAMMLMMGSVVVASAQKANPASDFEYDLSSNGTGILIQRYKGSAKDVIIPSIIEDFPVVSLSGTFKDNGYIRSVIIPNSVEEIGYCAFYKCTALTSINIPDSVKDIGEKAFSGCTSLTSVNIPDSVKEIGRAAFFECTSITSVTIGKGIESIGMYAFRDCSSLTTFNIGVQGVSYGYEVFSSCSSLSIKEKKKIRDFGYTSSF